MNHRLLHRNGLLLILFLLSVQMSAQVTRQPYLQIVTPNSIVVRWDSDSARVGTVYYGASTTSLTKAKSDTGNAIKHEITITGLSPKQKYYYSVTGPSGGTSDQYFVTAPVTGTRQFTRLWVISDFGQSFSTSDDARRTVTVNVWKEFNNNSLAADLVLSLGDQSESDWESQLQANYFNQLQDVLRITPLFTTVGNHDAGDQRVVYKASFTLPANAEAGGLASGTEDYYSFNYANIHVVVLCADGFDISPETEWLKNDLSANKSDWLIALMHHPMHSAGDHKSDTDPFSMTERANWLPVLEDAGVDLILAGHNHVYERSYMLDNLTGKSTSLTEANKIDTALGRIDVDHAYKKVAGRPHGGEIFVNCEGGGTSSDASNLRYPFAFTPVVFRGSDYEGSLVVDVDGSNRMDVKFLCDELDAKGSHIWDYFTILKSANATSVEDSRALLPEDFSISNYPNPFNPSTRISYTAPQTGHVTITIYDVLGRVVSTLVDGEVATGNHTIDWSGKDGRGNDVTSGMYIARIQSGQFLKSTKMMLLR
ncbi:T9SS C-terminal target domain-containing protein [bacterium]|nr:MAG: T9SS C-terminal target domain-containing protein [bacterium]